MKRFEIQVSWMMAATIEVPAKTHEEASRHVMTGTRPTNGSFVPFSMHVDSIEEERGDEFSKRLHRIK